MNAVIGISVGVALFRVFGLFVDFPLLEENLFKDFAHLFIGGLIGVWFVQPTSKCELCFLCDLLFGFWEPSLIWQMRIASALTWVEIICFGLSRIL